MRRSSGWVVGVKSWRVVLAPLAVALVAGCGARSSLDDEVAASGGTSAAPPQGTGGASVPPVPSVVRDACRRYCRGYSVECPEELKGRSCEADCEQGASASCQEVERAALDCLAPFFDDPNDPAETCGPASFRAQAQCRSELYERDKCRGATP